MSEEEDEEGLRHRSFLLGALFDSNDDQEGIAAKTGKFANNEYNMVNRRKYTRITRIAQHDTWDCGIACLLMISLWLRDVKVHDLAEAGNKRSLERKWLMLEVGTESIWTSDLMWQLQYWKTNRKPWWSFVTRLGGGIFDHTSFQEESKRHITFVLASKEIMNADESYRNFEYYQNAFEEDQSRVASTFQKLREHNVPMLQTGTQTCCDGEECKKGLHLSTIIEVVEREDCVAIVLLDNNVLQPGIIDQNNAPVMDDEASKTSSLPYAGHYVILCGTSNDPKHVFIANAGEESGGLSSEEDCLDMQFCFVVCNPDPSSTHVESNYVYVKPERFEAAWRAEGTDEDIIFLRKLPNR